MQQSSSSSNNITSTGSHKYKKDDDRQQRPSTWKIWVIASRPHTLTASVCPCLVSFAYCYNKYVLSTSRLRSSIGIDDTRSILYTYFTLWLLFCVTVQIGTNLHNDYSDFVQGADRKETRVGHLRATAMGWITPFQTCCAATTVLSITAVTGVRLMVISHQINNGWLWFWIASSVFNAFAYTGGPYPLGYIGLSHCSIAYYGLADIFVFLYFGLVATYMLPYLLQFVITDASHDRSLLDPPTLQIIIHGVQIGLLATNIIVVNNLRDCSTDVLAHKRTTTVRFGTTFSKIQYCGNYIATYLLVIVTTFIGSPPDRERSAYRYYYYMALSLLPLLTIVPAGQQITAILHKRGADLNPHVGGAAKVQLLFCILVTIRLLLLPFT